MVHFDSRYSCSQWQNVCFYPNFKEKIVIQGTKKMSPFYKILTALRHSKSYFCISNVEVCLLVNQIFEFLFYIIDNINGVSFPQFCLKRYKKKTHFNNLMNIHILKVNLPYSVIIMIYFFSSLKIYWWMSLDRKLPIF